MSKLRMVKIAGAFGNASPYPLLKNKTQALFYPPFLLKQLELKHVFNFTNVGQLCRKSLIKK